MSEDGEVEHRGQPAEQLLRRALLEFRSMSKSEQNDVQELLKRIFDPRGTVFCPRPWPYRWVCPGNNCRPELVFTRYASWAADEKRFTKLIVRFNNWADGDRSLRVFCLSYKELGEQRDVRVA